MKKHTALLYYGSLALMLLRGTLYQFCRLQYRGPLLMGRGARVLGLGKLKLGGVAKVGAHATLDARFCEGVQLGRRFSLGDFSIFRASGSPDFTAGPVTVGDNVTFGPYCNIGGGFGVVIGENCVFGPYVSIHPEGHVFANRSVPIREQGIVGTGIRLGADNWVGAKATVLDGARIGSGCVLGAACVVVAGVYADNGLYVGAPARLLRQR